MEPLKKPRGLSGSRSLQPNLRAEEAPFSTSSGVAFGRSQLSSSASSTWGDESATANVRVILRVRPIAEHEEAKGMYHLCFSCIL